MTRRLRIDDLATIAVPAQPAMSPDGSRIVYVLRTLDADEDRAVHRLWSVDTHGGSRAQAGEAQPRPLTYGVDDSSPAWSPDGTRLAFLRAHEGPAQVWLLPADGGEPEQLTRLPLGAGEPVWSPDGARLAFSAPVDPAARSDETAEAREARASAPIVADRLDYLADGAGVIRDVRAQVHVVDVSSAACRQLTHGTEHASSPAWSPDGTTLGFTAQVGDEPDLEYRAAVHLSDAADPKARPRVVGSAAGFAARVIWGADDDTLLVVGWPGDPTGHARLLKVTLDGTESEDLVGSLDRNVMPGAPAYPGALPQLTGDGRTVLFCLRDRGCTHLYAVDLSGGDPRLVLGGDGRVVSGLSVSGTRAAVVLATPSSYGEVVSVDLSTGEETVHTSHGAWLKDVDLFTREERAFTISDGTTVHGWLTRDPGLSEPGPVLLDIHGGPHNAWNAAADEMHLYHQELAARGWAVLTVNPRGSDGYGAAFYDAVSGAWGLSDAADFLEPLDQLVADGIADPTRLAVTGYSYGGYMTCYLTGHDDRFAAAIAGGVVSDLVSAGGTCADAHFLSVHELGGPPWLTRERYAEMSPYSRVSEVHTPTLILHGDADLTCPVGQAQQWHTALHERGVPTRLVRYPGASHTFILTGRPSHRLDYNRRVMDWAEQYAGSATGVRPARLDASHWQRRLHELAAKHEVVGASLGILRVGRDGTPDDLVAASHGVLSLRTGTPATPDAIFQIGSISKVWTATVAMQLVDEGLVELDKPVKEVLPELKLSDPGVTEAITLRHLLTHTGGIDGDIFTDTGRGDDCVERYVGLLADANQNHPLGATWSYCNSGYTLLGRVIEKLTDSTWDQALRDRLFTPLSLDHTVTLPEEALLFAAAVGHVAEESESPVVAPVWMMPRSLGPAGLVTSTVSDVLAFARMHLSGGRAPDGTQVLTETSVDAMAAHQADLPDPYILGDSWGLGWIRFDWNGHRLIGHDGNTIGQSAFLRMLPEQGLAVTLLTNVGGARDLYEDLYREIFAEVAGIDMPRPLAPPEQSASVDMTPYVGTYERASVRIDVFADADGGHLRTTVTGDMAKLSPEPSKEYPMVPVRTDLFVIRPPEAENWTPVTFYTLPTGEQYLHFGARATPKVS